MNNIMRLNKEIYSLQCIERAIHDYSSLATITIEETATYYICTFSVLGFDMDLIMHRFANYLIDIINVEKII